MWIRALETIRGIPTQKAQLAFIANDLRSGGISNVTTVSKVGREANMHMPHAM